MNIYVAIILVSPNHTKRLSGIIMRPAVKFYMIIFLVNPNQTKRLNGNAMRPAVTIYMAMFLVNPNHAKWERNETSREFLHVIFLASPNHPIEAHHHQNG